MLQLLGVPQVVTVFPHPRTPGTKGDLIDLEDDADSWKPATPSAARQSRPYSFTLATTGTSRDKKRKERPYGEEENQGRKRLGPLPHPNPAPLPNPTPHPSPDHPDLTHPDLIHPNPTPTSSSPFTAIHHTTPSQARLFRAWCCIRRLGRVPKRARRPTGRRPTSSLRLGIA